MENEAVLIDVTNGVATVTLNEPHTLNALSNEMAEGLTKVIQVIKEDTTIRSVILTGSGKAFSAGGNIKGFPKDINPSVMRHYIHKTIGFIKDLAQLEKPVLAAVNGYCVGAGFSIALACDLVLASPKAQFSLGFHKIGLVPDLGVLYHLPRVVGMARAKELAFSNRTLSATEAVTYGICLEVVEDDQLMQRTRQLAEEMAASATMALGLAKSMLNHSFESSLDDILNEEALLQTLAFATEDHKEGVQAFIEKRKPNFKGV
jgi:2-(1,2-epoxy-1,2-dihydrophenyl)acetyl-CoA isomerase